MNFKHRLILASSSPRRQFLMKEAGFDFTLEKPEGDESFSSSMPVNEVPGFLAEKKAKSIAYKIQDDDVILTSDTVVILEGQILNKPQDRADAIAMLTQLSGKTHTVITAVCLLSKSKKDCFEDSTKVTFKELSEEEIIHYVDRYHPFDKAGAYGAQDWIGMVAITKIEGSYFTVMGLPMHKVYTHLQQF
ncbi:MAG: septum formation protein Maf [Cyclobacteriaceae bacterium]|nr:septum formation protein Maf [Cyclobacteriaceae bacterium]